MLAIVDEALDLRRSVGHEATVPAVAAMLADLPDAGTVTAGRPA